MKGGQILMTVQNYHESAICGMPGVIGVLLLRVIGSLTCIWRYSSASAVPWFSGKLTADNRSTD